MDDGFFDIVELVSKYMTGELTGAERESLDNWLSLSEDNRKWFHEVTEKEFIYRKRQELKSIDVKGGWKALSRKRAKENRRRLGIRALKYACVFILLVVSSMYFLMQRVDREEIIPVESAEILPGTSRAILYMANGSIIDLANHDRDSLRELDGTIIGLDGESITYKNAVDSVVSSDLYNELVIPRGGEYVLTLADGTLVCLNAGSKLRFPVQFSGITRKVELEGEGYFQVVRNEEMPFVVNASGVNITVLGTEFNVSNYPENEDVQTTLIKGKVQVTLSEDTGGYILHPGEQAVYNKENGEITVANVDVSYVTAWREGRLRFRDRPLKEIMDFISRWYDVDVVYEDESVKNYLFGCNFNRHVTVTPLLELFQSTGTVRFEVVGKKIIVKK